MGFHLPTFEKMSGTFLTDLKALADQNEHFSPIDYITIDTKNKSEKMNRSQ